jgi:putative heme utilization carrier protein HutX
MLVLALSLVPGVPYAGESSNALCATTAQKVALATAWAAKAPRLATLARSTGVSEAAALSSLPAERAVGVSGAAFVAVWKSLQAWPDAVTVIAKADQVFEVHGRIPSGEPSKVSKYFNLDPKAQGITGHLRPDLYSGIYATSLPGRDRVEHGILFFDPAGQLIFGVYVPNEHAVEDSRVLEAFRTTSDLIAAAPPLCPAG